MKYRAEIFDMTQYLFDTTGFNDHQLHCVIQFKEKVDAAAMEKAFRLLVETVPILSRVYRNLGGRSYWEDADRPNDRALLTIAGSPDDFNSFTFSKTDAETGPQIRGCLLQAENDALSVIVNHMVTDGAGMKELMCLLSRIYSAILLDPFYKPDFIIDGDRSYGAILSPLSLRDRARILFFRSGDNNSSGKDQFPLSAGDGAAPFICTHQLPPEMLREIIAFSKKHGATVNDIILAAYFRALSSMLGLQGAPLSVPLMIDMRRYLEDKSFSALRNLASTEIMRLAVRPGEAFSETVAHVSAATKAKKDNDFGLNSFVKLQTLFQVCGHRQAYRLLEKHLKNPNICITNIGVIDDKKLRFEGAEVDNAYITGSIKYRPHFQMSLSTYRDKLTLAVNLYGNRRDMEKIREFFDLMDRELIHAGACTEA